MKIREADSNDKNRWDSFVESEGGAFPLYFEWKQFYEARGDRFIPLMIENDSSQLLGILAVVRERKFLYSLLVSLPEGGGGFLIKNDLSESEKYEAVCALVEYTDLNYAKGCAGLFIRERIAYFDKRYGIPVTGLVNSGLSYHYNETTGLPCTHIMELNRPFEENHWGKWPHKIKQKINKAVKNGVAIIYDRELLYLEEFIEMLGENYKRHRNKRPIEDDTKIRIKVFKEKTKLYIALLDGQPVAGLLCHYTPLTCQLAKVGSYTRDNGNAEQLCFKVAIEDACTAGFRFVDFDISTDENTAFYKGQFKQFTKLPMGTYEKTYSKSRYCLYQASALFEILGKDKMYLWNNRKYVWKKIFSRQYLHWVIIAFTLLLLFICCAILVIS